MCIFKFLTCFFVLFTFCNGTDLEERQPAGLCSASTADPDEQQEAKALAKWLVESHKSDWGSRIAEDYRINANLTGGHRWCMQLREGDPEATETYEKKPAKFFVSTKNDSWSDEMRSFAYNLRWRYLEDDTVRYCCDASFQRLGQFPGLSFFNVVVEQELRYGVRHVSEALKNLPEPYSEAFTEVPLPTDERPYNFLNALKLYKRLKDSYSHDFSRLSLIIAALHKFSSATEETTEALHSEFIKSLEENLFSIGKISKQTLLSSGFVAEVISIYKSRLLQLPSDVALQLCTVRQASVAASLINLTEMSDTNMDNLLIRFKKHLKDMHLTTRQLAHEQIR